MSKSTKIIFTFAVGLILLYVAYLAFGIWKSAEHAAKLSCVSSIADVAERSLNSGNLQAEIAPREITKKEFIKMINEGSGYDCSGHEYIFGQVHIVISGINKNSKPKIKVWTDGDDAIAGTEDDLEIPYDENIQ